MCRSSKESEAGSQTMQERFKEDGGVTTLFRKEVMLSNASSSVGNIALAPPKIASYSALASSIAVLVIIAIIAFGTYTPTVSSTGETVIDPPATVIKTPKNGIIRSILVTKGAMVTKGQPMIALSTALSTPSSENTSEAISSTLENKLEKLEEQIANLNANLQGNRSTIEEKIKLATAKYESAADKIRLQSQRTNSAAQLYERWRLAGETGVVSKLQILQQQDQMLASRAELDQARRDGLQDQQDIENLKQELKDIQSKHASDSSELKLQINDIKKEMLVNAQDGEIILRAPEPGKISTILVASGQNVTPNDSLIIVSPKTSKLRVSLNADQDLIPYINKGQRVIVSYQAFPFTKRSPMRGRVSDISPLAQQASGKGVGQAAALSKVTVDISESELRHDGNLYHLSPGLTVDAKILLDKRSIIYLGKN